MLWFNLHPKFWKLCGYNIKLFNLFARDVEEGPWWGIGIFQINSRHLFYIGHSGVCILFVWILGAP